MDIFKCANVKDYTANDLNCRKYVPHTKTRNQIERKLRKKARQKLKYDLRKDTIG